MAKRQLGAPNWNKIIYYLAVGCCCEMQWIAPNPQIKSLQSMPTTLRSGKKLFAK